jgi:hypothetical protein
LEKGKPMLEEIINQPKIESKGQSASGLILRLFFKFPP